MEEGLGVQRSEAGRIPSPGNPPNVGVCNKKGGSSVCRHICAGLSGCIDFCKGLILMSWKYFFFDVQVP